MNAERHDDPIIEDEISAAEKAADTSDKQSVTEALRKTVELQNKTKESESKILVAGSTEYITAEQQKPSEVDPTTRVIEQHYHSDSGQEVVLLGTEHTYDANSPEAQYLGSLVRAIPPDSKKVLILEGQYDDATELPDDPEEAIRVGGGEFAYMGALAKQQGVEFVPAEPDPHENAQKILVERPDITRDEIALHYALKVLVGVFRYDEASRVEDVAPYIHHAVGIAGNTSEGGWVEKSTSRDGVLNMSESEKTEVTGEMPTIVEKLNSEFAKIYPGKKLLDLQPDGSITLLYDLNQQPVPWDPTPDREGRPRTKISEISSMDMLMRDRHTFELANQAIERGQEPIIVVGNSHASTLKPAFESQFQKVA